MSKCKGFFGWLFGHAYVTIYDEVHIKHAADLSGIKVEGGLSVVQTLVDGLTKIETTTTAIKTYCKRCGVII
jgi:hypothetical protein